MTVIVLTERVDLLLSDSLKTNLGCRPLIHAKTCPTKKSVNSVEHEQHFLN